MGNGAIYLECGDIGDNAEITLQDRYTDEEVRVARYVAQFAFLTGSEERKTYADPIESIRSVLRNHSECLGLMVDSEEVASMALHAYEAGRQRV